MQKHKPIRMKKIRDSARGQECQANTPYCNHDSDTVVLCHYGTAGEKGMGLKPSDTSAAYCCSGCHDWLDMRTQSGVALESQDREYYWFRALRRTWALLVANGVLK